MFLSYCDQSSGDPVCWRELVLPETKCILKGCVWALVWEYSSLVVVSAGHSLIIVIRGLVRITGPSIDGTHH